MNIYVNRYEGLSGKIYPSATEKAEEVNVCSYSVQHASTKPQKHWLNVILRVQVEGRGFSPDYRPDPKDGGRIVQYQNGGNNLVSYPSSSSVRDLESGIVFDARMWGEQLEPGIYWAELSVSGGHSGGGTCPASLYIYRPNDKD